MKKKTIINRTAKDRKYQFVFAYPQSEVVFDGFKSEAAKELIEVVPVYREMKTKAGEYLKKIFLSVTINRYIRMPFRSLFHTINNYCFNDDCDYYVIVPTMSLIRWEIYEIERLKNKHPNLKMILLLLDSIHSGSNHLKYVKEKLFSDVWDLTITYDRYDAKEFGFTWLGYSYYPQCDILPYNEKTSDCLYIGYDKGERNKTIVALYDRLKDNGVDCDFRIVKNGNRKCSLPQGILYTDQKYRYCEIASLANNTNCIVEILMDGQMTQSYRYFEAITYNKKLLTNNPNVSQLPYYDKRFMRYFSCIDEVDTDWVKKKESINYEYGGEFSQLHLLDFIKKEFGI